MGKLEEDCTWAAGKMLRRGSCSSFLARCVMQQSLPPSPSPAGNPCSAALSPCGTLAFPGEPAMPPHPKVLCSPAHLDSLQVGTSYHLSGHSQVHALEWSEFQIRLLEPKHTRTVAFNGQICSEAFCLHRFINILGPQDVSMDDQTKSCFPDIHNLHPAFSPR